MFIAKRKGLLLSGLILVAIILVALLFSVPSKTASAETVSDILNYTLVTDSQGNDSYSVSIKSAAKPTAEFVVVPEEYNGKPVTAVAMNGFMSSAKLQKVVLPKSIKDIGNNAFMNCAKLERVSMLRVENIGMNAFAMCPNLSGLFFPRTVMNVGSNVLRGNANRIYIQNSKANIDSNWQATWSSYFTGDTIYDASTENALHYRQILDAKGNVIGYELDALQAFADEANDLVIYDTFKADDDTPYLPVLNICPEAFILLSSANSVVFKIRPETASDPKYPHFINIRSYAFYSCAIPTISFELPITFEHPQGLQHVSEYMGIPSIEGDKDGKSINVFEESAIESITLPSEIDIIPEGMFAKCSYLREIRIYGEKYTNENVLPSVTTIGARAFDSSPAIPNLTIPKTVEKVGKNIFNEWGTGEAQTINIQFYQDGLPNGWDSDWCNGINTKNTVITYKQLVDVIVDMQNGVRETISVKPGISMPELSIPVWTGHTFKGVYANKDGTGKQFYTSEMKIKNIWNEGDPKAIYGCWDLTEYSIEYNVDLRGLNNPNPKKFTIEDEIYLIDLKLEGYDFKWGQNYIPKNTTQNLIIKGTWIAKRYEIKFENVWNGTYNPNSTTYSYDEEVILSNATYGGYVVTWDKTRIPVHTVGPVTVRASYREKNLSECFNGNICEIWTKNQMSAIRNFETSRGSYFQLMRSVTLDNWEPIPTFNGNFDLNNFHIYINNSAVPNESDYGFIIENNGLIFNGNFHPNLVGKGGYSTELNTQTKTGVICAVNNGTIDSCIILKGNTTTDITIKNYLTTFGAVCGINNGTVTGCTNNALITSYCVRTGGIAGFNSENAKITNCTNTGRIDLYAYSGSITLYTGGITGITYDSSKVQNCNNQSYLYFAGYTSTNYEATIYMAAIAGGASKSATFSENTIKGRGWVQANPNITQYVRGNVVDTLEVAYYFDVESSGEGGCVSTGTLITLADGSQVPVESLTGNEMLLVWNLETGCFDIAPILFIDSDPEKVYEVINLYFSDGTSVKVITEHAFWDFNLNEYVFLREDAARYIGHWFNKQATDSYGNNSWTKVQLINVVITEEYTSAWSPVTYGHLCYYVNGMLSMPGATEGLINIFGVNAETMQYDKESFEADIEKYGLFTYEEFSELLPISEEIFKAFNGQYLKVSIGKGLVDLETLSGLLERYQGFFATGF